MKTKRLFLMALLLSLGLILAGGVELGLAQAPEGTSEDGLQGDAGLADYLWQPTMSYQGKLLQSGSPVNGTKAMTFRLYKLAAGGSPIWEEGPKSVAVNDGLFSTVLGDTNPMTLGVIDDCYGELWLEVVVSGTTMPRQKLHGAPYAYTLVPGADIRGNISGGGSALYVYNGGSTGNAMSARAVTGHGLKARSAGSGLPGAGVYALSTGAGGIALWAHNDSGTSTDATFAVSNDGTGDLVKGFGGDGGEDEFRIRNDGTFETKADSYFFIPGTEFVRNLNTDTTRWDCRTNGSAQFWRGAATGGKSIYIPVTLPGVLYGKEVEVKTITIYYKCADGTKSYISSTYLVKQTDADSGSTLVSSTTDRTSNTATSYTLDVNETLSSGQGILCLYLNLSFADDAHDVRVGGVKVRLGHHHLY